MNIDGDLISTFCLYWFYMTFGFLILTIGYKIADKFLHFTNRSKH